MKKFPRFPILPVLILVLLFGAFSFAAAEPARDITRECRLKPVSGGKELKKALDRDYKTFWRSSGGAGAVPPVEGQGVSAMADALALGTPDVELFGSDGKLIAAYEADGHSATLDLSAYPAGTYVVRITTSAGVTNKRLVKK